MMIFQNKYTHVMALFACCMAGMVSQMYSKISPLVEQVWSTLVEDTPMFRPCTKLKCLKA